MNSKMIKKIIEIGCIFSIFLMLFSCTNNSNYYNKKTNNSFDSKKKDSEFHEQLPSNKKDNENNVSVAKAYVGKLAGFIADDNINMLMNDDDYQLIKQSAHKALEFSPTGNVIEWKNPNTGIYGSISPTRTFKTKTELYCREYIQKLIIDNQKWVIYATACRNPKNFSWEIIR